MTEDKKPEMNGPPGKPNQNHGPRRGGPDGGGRRFGRGGGPRREPRDRDHPNADQVSGVLGFNNGRGPGGARFCYFW